MTGRPLTVHLLVLTLLAIGTVLLVAVYTNPTLHMRLSDLGLC